MTCIPCYQSSIPTPVVATEEHTMLGEALVKKYGQIPKSILNAVKCSNDFSWYYAERIYKHIQKEKLGDREYKFTAGDSVIHTKLSVYDAKKKDNIEKDIDFNISPIDDKLRKKAVGEKVSVKYDRKLNKSGNICLEAYHAKAHGLWNKSWYTKGCATRLAILTQTHLFYYNYPRLRSIVDHLVEGDPNKYATETNPETVKKLIEDGRVYVKTLNYLIPKGLVDDALIYSEELTDEDKRMLRWWSDERDLRQRKQKYNDYVADKELF